MTDIPTDTATPAALAEYFEAVSVRLGTLVNIRWMAIVGQSVALLAVYFGLGLQFPLLPAALVVVLSVAINLYLFFGRGPGVQLSEREAAVQLAYDLGQLAVLLYLTGGIQNPFSVLMIAPVTISAAILGRHSTLALLAVAIVLSLVLVFFHQPLPWDGQALVLAPLYRWGLWGGVAVSMVFLAWYAARISGEARRRATALAATRAALERERHLAALGTLAAAAAHELGTPLGTILLTARELDAEQVAGTDAAADIALIVDQANRCRDILKSLAVSHGGRGGALFERVPAEVVVREAARPYEGGSKQIVISAGAASQPAKLPQLADREETRYGLGNFIENAVSYAAARVDIELLCQKDDFVIRIRDDGPGFSSHVLQRLGEPYVSNRKRDQAGEGVTAGGLGLGIFIAKTLIEETGGQVAFSNDISGGACVSVKWRLTEL